MLSKSEILEAKDIESETITISEWGGDVIVTGLSLADKDKWTSSIMVDGKPDMEGATAKLCIMCMRDEAGEQLFSFKDRIALQKKSASALDKVFQVAQRLSGIGQEEVEETVKNSEKTQTPDSD